MVTVHWRCLSTRGVGEAGVASIQPDRAWHFNSLGSLVVPERAGVRQYQPHLAPSPAPLDAIKEVSATDVGALVGTTRATSRRAV